MEPRGRGDSRGSPAQATQARARMVLISTKTSQADQGDDPLLSPTSNARQLSVAVQEYFDLLGAWPSRYRFFVLNERGNTAYTVALSSSTVANTNALKLLGHPTKEWVFHLDLEADGAATTFKVFEGEPSYDTVKPLVIEAIRQQELKTQP
jgi:hypothetical protein